MSTDKLTPTDPVPPETLKRFDELDSARYELGLQLLVMEQEKVRVLSAAHQVDQEKKRLFESVLIERGLAPDTKVQIDSKTGVVAVLP